MEPPNKRKPHAPKPAVLSITPAGIWVEDHTIRCIWVTRFLSPISINKFSAKFQVQNTMPLVWWNCHLQLWDIFGSIPSRTDNLFSCPTLKESKFRGLALQHQRKRAPSGRRRRFRFLAMTQGRIQKKKYSMVLESSFVFQILANPLQKNGGGDFPAKRRL